MRARLWDTTLRGATGKGLNTHVVALGLMLAVITFLHLYTDPSMETLHAAYRRLYYIPILYAGFVFGLRGGLLTAFGAALLISPTAIQASADLVDMFNEVVMYLVIGGLFGWMREVEDARSDDLREVSQKLESAYGKLEERTVELIRIQEYTSSVLQSVATGVMSLGPDGSIATANAAAERLLGLPEEEMVPRPIAALLRDDGGVGSDIAKVLQGRQPRTYRDATLRTRDGQELHVQVAVSPMRDLDGRTRGAVLALEDVSEVKSLAAQLLRADRLAALGELTAGVAHEVRNPLGIIRATVQLLEEQQFDPQKGREAGAVITQEVDRLDTVIKALLDFGRPWSPTLMRVSVNRLLEEVVLFTSKWAGRSEVELDISYGADTPQVLADPHQIKQVFVNLISNAVQAMDGGGRLSVSTGCEEGYVWIRFADDGPGMAADTMSKVFDPFFSTREDGTGLGMTIVHRIIDEHGGHIDVTSALGAGTVFTIHLPVRAEEPRPGPAGRGEPSDSIDRGER